MSDTGSGPKPAKAPKTAKAPKAAKTARKSAGPDWNASADGKSVSKSFQLPSPADAAKLAKRALQFAQKNGQTFDLHFAGAGLTVTLPAIGGVAAPDARRLARRLDTTKSGDKPAKAAKPAKAPAAAKSAKPKAEPGA